MMLIIYTIIAISVISFLCFIIKLNNKNNLIKSLKKDLASFMELRTSFESQLDEAFEHKGVLQKKIEQLIAENSENRSKLSCSLEYSSKIEKDNLQNIELFKEKQEELFHVKQALELKIQEMHEFDKRVSDWGKSREEAIQQSKAAIFDTASKLSEQLIAQHKSESKESEDRFSKISGKLYEQFDKVVSSVSILNEDVKKSKSAVDHVKKTLLSPAGAGSLAEITLENILKASGLENNRDFIMQYSFDDKLEKRKMRPDAVVFLPADNVMIIDSKASKYFAEIYQESNNETKKTISAKLKATMRSHLKSLSSKDYQESFRYSFNSKKIHHISSIMFLPSETAIEKISEIDKEFINAAWEKDIIPIGPLGLANILSYTKFQISVNKQTENHQMIIEEIRKMLNSLSVLYSHAQKLGNSLYQATNHFDKFAGSFNTGLLPKARNLNKLGVHLQKNKQLPKSIDRFSILTSNKIELVEAKEDTAQEE